MPSGIANTIYVVAAIVWTCFLVLYFKQGRHHIAEDLHDPVFAPFIAGAPITGMVLSLALADFSFELGRALVVLFLAATRLIGIWLTGHWIVADLEPDTAHPGYFLPTVAGGLIGAFTAAEVQLQSLAEWSFGTGIISWLLIGSIVLNVYSFGRAFPRHYCQH